jgi:putative ABC transport system substrate-binding protein
VSSGLITSLNRPEGNVTGISYNSGALVGKTLAYLHDVVPQATTLAVLPDPRFPLSGENAKQVALLSSLLWREVIVLDARSDRDFEPGVRHG